MRVNPVNSTIDLLTVADKTDSKSPCLILTISSKRTQFLVRRCSDSDWLFFLLGQAADGPSLQDPYVPRPEPQRELPPNMDMGKVELREGLGQQTNQNVTTVFNLY